MFTQASDNEQANWHIAVGHTNDRYAKCSCVCGLQTSSEFELRIRFLL